MKNRLLAFLVLSVTLAAGGATAADNTADTIVVDLPCDPQVGSACTPERIEIPNGRPIYALFVSGFHQNKSLDMFHFYGFAKCLLEKGAYVHYSWWNNLLAPYMEEPLHNDASVPSHRANPCHDYWQFLYVPDVNYPTKALPPEDYQFQADAKLLLEAIRANNPDAAIILVGHSMGGDAIVRLARNANVDIDLLAPIDPVGNRTCLPNNEGETVTWYNNNCTGAYNFTRFQATHEDGYWWPDRIQFGREVKYLYHRWQNEGLPPYDWWCPLNPVGCPLQLHMQDEPLPDRYHFAFDFPNDRANTIEEAAEIGSTNVQSVIDTNEFSDKDIPLYFYFPSGLLDGHGELVGFRGAEFEPDLVCLLSVESYPLALKAEGNWPVGGCEIDEFDPDRVMKCRVDHLEKWDDDPNYLYKSGLEPWNPGLCMVSRDLCKVLDSIIVEPSSLVADAGPDQTAECGGPNGAEVTLDGSGSTGPDDDSLVFSWDWSGGTMTGETIDLYLPVGTHSITLTVDNGEGNTDTDTVVVTVVDSTAPSLSVSLLPDSLWPPNHKMVSITASIQVGDTCDTSPDVELVSITSSEADDGWGDGSTSDDIQGASFGTDDRTFSLRAERAGFRRGRIYTVTYGATDASGNLAEASAEVTVSHDRR